jgi:hypothetical protein
LRQAWHRHPDWRLNQLLINASDTPYDCEKPHDCSLGLVYCIEDEMMEKRLGGIARHQASPPDGRYKSLAEAVVEAASFMELSSDEVIDPDSALQALESISHSLQTASDREIQALLRYCRDRATTLAGEGEQAEKRRAFYRQFGEAMGLTGA